MLESFEFIPLLAGLRQYRRNLSYTINVILLAIPVMTVLYAHTWYFAMNQVVLQTSDDTVVS